MEKAIRERVPKDWTTAIFNGNDYLSISATLRKELVKMEKKNFNSQANLSNVGNRPAMVMIFYFETGGTYIERDENSLK